MTIITDTPDQRAARQRLIEDHFRAILDLIGEDPDREGLLGTPERVARMWMNELASGYDDNPKLTQFAIPSESSEIVIVQDIPFTSCCEHHMVPFLGTFDVAYIPRKTIIGLSKIPRLINKFARRLQVQERLTSEVANALTDALDPTGVMVICTARHMCMEIRGVHAVGATTTTSALRGVFKYNPTAKSEVLSLLRRAT